MRYSLPDIDVPSRGKRGKVRRARARFTAGDRDQSLVFRADDGSFLFALMSADGSVSEKKIARASGHKRVTPANPHDAERITAYQVGGISPLGAKNTLPVFLDHTSASHEEVVINAGARGTMLRLATADLIGITQAITADIRIE